MQIEKQKVNWSTAVKISTLAIGAIILIAAYALIQYFSQNLDSMYTFVILALFLIFLYFVLQSPRYIVLTEKEIILQKLVGNLSPMYIRKDITIKAKPIVTIMKGKKAGKYSAII